MATGAFAPTCSDQGTQKDGDQGKISFTIVFIWVSWDAGTTDKLVQQGWVRISGELNPNFVQKKPWQRRIRVCWGDDGPDRQFAWYLVSSTMLKKFKEM